MSRNVVRVVVDQVVPVLTVAVGVDQRPVADTGFEVIAEDDVSVASIIDGDITAFERVRCGGDGVGDSGLV